MRAAEAVPARGPEQAGKAAGELGSGLRERPPRRWGTLYGKEI